MNNPTVATGPLVDGISARAAWYMIAVLTFAYILSYIDRVIFGLLIGPIRAEFAIDDTVFSLLYGFGFAFFYTLIGIPLGWAADRYNRRNLVVLGIAAWSAMTAACGLARSFSQLALARIAVGIGEATLSPATYSMAGDSFPARQLGRAMSVFVVGFPLGIGLALIIGGLVIGAIAGHPLYTLPLVGAVKSWQACFLVIGPPGLLVALLALTIREPPRLHPAGPVRGASFAATARTLRQHWPGYCCLTFGFSMLSIVVNTYQLWGVQHFVRVFGFSTARAGLWLGSLIAVAGTLGILTGGWLHDRLLSRGYRDAALRVGLVAACAMLPSAVCATLMPTPELTLLMLLPIGFFNTFGHGASGAAVVLMTPPNQRAQVTGIYLFVVNIVAMGLGPLLTASLNDHVFHSDLAVGKSIALVATSALVVACVLFVAGSAYLGRRAPAAPQPAVA